MALETYKVQAPNGEIIVMEGPPGATDEQLFSQAKLMMRQKPQASVTVEGAPEMPNKPNAFGQNDGGAAFGRPNVRGQLNVQAQPRPLESALAGATKSMVTDPALGLTQLLSGGTMGNDAIDRIQAEFKPYQDANPKSAFMGQVGGAVLPAARVGSAIGSAVGKIPSYQSATANLLRQLPEKVAPLAGRVGTGMGYGAVSSAFSPDTVGANPEEVMGNRMKNMALDTTIGGALPVGLEAGKQLAKGAGFLGSEGLGLTTGTNGEIIREAYKAGKKGNEQFIENMRGEVPVTDVLESAQGALSTMKQSRREAFEKGFESTRKNQVFLDFKPIENKFNEFLKKYDYEGVGGVNVSTIGDKTRNEINNIGKLVKEWKSKPEVHTAEGLDALKRRIDDLWSMDMPREAKTALTQTRNVVKNTIAKQDPNYAKTMRDYEKSLGVEREIEKALGLGDEAAVDTAIRKLQSLTRNNANTNYSYRQELADLMKAETGVDLMPALSGQALSAKTPRGLSKLVSAGTVGASFANPALLATLPLQSPRLMGEALYKMGQGASKMPSANLTQEQKKLADLLMQQTILKGRE